MDTTRLTQEVVEVGETAIGYAGGNTTRLGQEAVEVGETGIAYAGGNRTRLTQEVVEVGESVPYAGGNTVRLTQIVVEVGITSPSYPFPPLSYPDVAYYSPAAGDSNIGLQGNLYASYFGIHTNYVNLGQRRQWLIIVRR